MSELSIEQAQGSLLSPPRQRFIAIVFLILALLSLCTRWLWIGNLLNHLSAHVVLLLLLCVPLCARQKLPSFLLLVALFIFACPWLYQAYEKRADNVAVDDEAGAVFMMLNTAWWNVTDPNLVCASILEADPDFCAVIEARPELSKTLRQSRQWPFYRGTTRVGPYSMMIVTRLEIIDDSIQVLGGTKRALDIDPGSHSIDALADKDMLIFNFLIRLDGEIVRVVVAHPPPPVVPSLLNDRSAVFSAVAAIVKKSEEPCIVMGDFNTVPASFEWRTLHKLGLRRPHGLQMRTWMLRSFEFLRQGFGLAIDYICSSADLRMSPLQYRQVAGSDHLALLSRITLQPVSAAAAAEQLPAAPDQPLSPDK